MTTAGVRRRRRSTIEDVALAAGVSVATVSRALRGLPNVAIATRDRVARVAADMQYSPDPAAARLAAGTTNAVTVVVPHLRGWYFSTVIAAVEEVCTAAGYDVLVLGLGEGNDPSRIMHEAHHLERRTDGLVFVDVPLTEQQAQAISARGVAIATIGSQPTGHPSVRIDDTRVGRLAAEHLADLGHTRFGVIGGYEDDPMSFAVPQVRHSGFVDALKKRGLVVPDDMVVGGGFEITGGRAAMQWLLDQPVAPTAVFAMSDEMAFGALMELNSRGLRPGADVSVIGVDDHEFSAVVSLTTIAQPVAQHGAVAAERLLDSMRRQRSRAEPAAEQPTNDIVAPVRLIVRSTTGPA